MFSLLFITSVSAFNQTGFYNNTTFLYHPQGINGVAGKCLYVVSNDSVTSFNISGANAINPVKVDYFRNATLLRRAVDVEIHPDNTTMYVSFGGDYLGYPNTVGGGLATFSILDNCSMTYLTRYNTDPSGFYFTGANDILIKDNCVWMVASTSRTLSSFDISGANKQNPLKSSTAYWQTNNLYGANFIANDSSGRLYVLDSNDNGKAYQMVVYSTSGCTPTQVKELGASNMFGTGEMVNAPYLYTAVPSANKIRVFNINGVNATNPQYVTDIVDVTYLNGVSRFELFNNTLYAVNYGNSRITELDINGLNASHPTVRTSYQNTTSLNYSYNLKYLNNNIYVASINGNSVTTFNFGGGTGGNATPVLPPSYQCSDSIDNDLDGFIDYPTDPSCSNLNDTTESPVDSTNCSEATCSQSAFCIYLSSFSCSDELKFHGWTSTPDFYTLLMKPVNKGILLNEWLDNTASYTLNNGTGVSTQSQYSLKTPYSNNKKDYIQTEQNFIFYFNKDHYATNYVEQWVNFSLIGENGGSAINFSIHPVPHLTDNDVDLYIYANGTVYTTTAFADGNGRFELQVRTFMPDFYHPNARYDFYYRSPRFTTNYSWLYSNTQFNFLTAETYINNITLQVSGDPANQYAQHNAPVYMYLQKIDAKGVYDQTTNPTECTTYTAPYILRENFQGCLGDCGWTTIPNSLCVDGTLSVQTSDSIGISKFTTPLTKTTSRYSTLNFNIQPVNTEYGGGFSIQVYDDTPENIVYLLIADGGGSPVIYNLVDGNYLPIAVLSYGLETNVQVLLDLGTDTFSLYIDSALISSGNKFVNTFKSYDNIYAVSMISSNFGFIFDDLSFYTSTVSNTPSVINLNPPPSKAQNTSYSMCGYINKNPSSCIDDSDCLTGICQPNSKCSTFDYTYCDENGMNRGNGCFLSAMAKCGLNNTKDAIFNNFLLFAVFLILVMVITYFAIMMRSGKG